MATRPVEIGTFGETVRRNLVRFRGLRGLLLKDVSARMSELGRPMGVSTLSGIENGNRRIDADDLVCLALVLNVSPAALLMPPETDPGLSMDSPIPAVTTGQWWGWLTASAPLDAPDSPDTFEVERWRRDQVPPFAWNRGASNG
jgi:transcriptional regulator with XRE-family HTH domain